MAYGIILTIASILLAGRYAFDTSAPAWSRVTVAVIVALTFSIPATPVGTIVATLGRLGVCLFILLRAAAARVG